MKLNYYNTAEGPFNTPFSDVWKYAYLTETGKFAKLFNNDLNNIKIYKR